MKMKATKHITLFFMLLIGSCSIIQPMARCDDITARSTKTFAIPGDYQTRMAYDVNSDPEYVGVADRGLASNQKGWLVLKITWVSRNPTLVQTGKGAWDSRTGLTYE